MKAKRMLLVMATALGAGAVQAGPEVGVSVSVGQPGFYGRIDIGNGPPPAVVYPQPVIIHQPAVVVPRAPIYLRVRPGHERDWGRYCHHYGACGQPVYFVRADAGGPPRGFHDGDHEHKGKHKHKHEGHPHGGKHGGKGEGKGHGHKHD